MQTIAQETASQVKWNVENGKFLLNESLRSKALEVIETTSFPTTKTEAWKYTRLTKIKNAELNITGLTHSKIECGLSSESLKFVFINGHFSVNHSSNSYPEGLKIEALSQMDSQERLVFGNDLTLENELFNAFNTAYATDGLYIHVSAKMNIKPVIEIIHIVDGSNVLSNLRNIISTEAFSQINIVQHFISTENSSGFTNCVNEISVGKNSKLTIDKLQEENENQFHIASEIVQQAQDSIFTINTVTLNGALVRNNLTINVNGQNCETNLNGAYILKGSQHVDNHTIVDHKVANCLSNELYKGVINDKATAVFNGKVFVRKDAQKINAFQSNGNVLLSDDATVNSKPELEIYADDVKCSHGSTTGQLDEEAVFYLRARGISEKAARQLMVSAFVGDVFEKIENESVVERIYKVLEEKFDWAF